MPDSAAYDLYDRDIARRLEHSETRIKNWVIGGILANLLVLIGMGVPMVYYLGTLNAQTTQAIATINTNTLAVTGLSDRLKDLEFEQRSLETWAAQQGYQTPHK